MSSPLPRFARTMTATGVAVVSLGTAAALTSGTAVAATNTATTATSSAVAADGAAGAEVKAPRPRLRAVKLSVRRSVIYPGGTAPRTSKHYRKIYVKLVKQQRNQPVRVRAIARNGRPMGPWIKVSAHRGRTVALTKAVRDGVPFKLQWAQSRAGQVRFYLYY
ncbi:hypothetical protein ACGFNU_00550 [Spirillospora sp. NPDC048911]|uniref:hypothetical protein n=1 Tax=Spirillospora sp. NPDC048911 TaxID=3364527 RepID=UPI0037177361